MRSMALCGMFLIILVFSACDPSDRDVCLYHNDCPACYLCNNGSCELDEGQLNACGGCGEVTELCDNGEDDDCDGLTDEGCGDSCQGVTCDSPPGPECIDASTLRVYKVPGQCLDGDCVYAYEDVTCQDGCENDNCNTDPCEGIVCDSPPNGCYQPTGNCYFGTCRYEYLDGALCIDGDPCTINDACASGVCSGTPMLCDNPPEDKCHDAGTLRIYPGTGACQGGTCSYDYQDTHCTYGCYAAECLEEGINVVTSPSRMDFGDIILGCGDAKIGLSICNIGTAQESITQIYLQNAQETSFTVGVVPPLPFVLQSDGCLGVQIYFHPHSVGLITNTLVIGVLNSSDVEVPITGTGISAADAVDQFDTPEVLAVDVLWVVENSASMAMTQPDIVAASGKFINQAVQHGVDFHIGVIATEVNSAETDLSTPPRDIYPGVLVQAPGRPKIITSSTPDLAAAFADNLRLGDCCSDEQEAGFQAARMALSAPIVSDPAKNAGFLREEARLAVIVMGDEDDQSDGSIDTYETFFLSLKEKGGDWFSFSAITGDVPDGCGQWTEACVKYVEMINQTGGMFQSVCASDFNPVMTALGRHAFMPPRVFLLTHLADSSSISVTVNQVTVPRASTYMGADGWTYLIDDNAIWFGDDVIPPNGSSIEARYRGICP